MAKEVAGLSRATGDQHTRRLLVEFSVVLAESHPRPLFNLEEPIVDVRHQLGADICHLDTKVTDTFCDCSHECTSVEHVDTEIQPDCACPTFLDHGCVPQITGSDGSEMTIKTYLSDREPLTDLIDDLRSAVESVSIRRLKRVDTQQGGDRQKFVTLDLYKLTEKQRQAVTAAVAAGYYETPP